jgi:cytochrome d ubiquinol oxidase subunit I
MFSMAMWMALLVAPLQILAGDIHGLNTLEHQPAKIAAMEGHYQTQRGAPLILFGIPDDAAGETRHALEIPRLGSLILTHDWNGEVKGLDAFPENERPSAELIFWTFRIMVAIGVAMVGIGLWSAVARLRGRLFDDPWLLRAAALMTPSGFAAVLAGWITTEVGRQPWTVYGLLRTSESAAPIEAAAVGASLVVFVLVYLAVFGAGTYYALVLMASPPGTGKTGDDWLTRSAGITPGPAMREALDRPTAEEDSHGN